MHDGPDGATLLEIARATLLRDILPHLAGEKRYAVLMTANAMAIAKREMEDKGAAATQERALIGRVYAAEPAAGAPPRDNESMTDLNRRLAWDLRARRFGPAAVEALASLFDHQIAVRLALANPRYAGGRK